MARKKKVNLANNQSELAAALGCDRHMIKVWRDKYEDFPKDRAGGRWDIDEVKAFILSKNLLTTGRRGVPDYDGDDDNESYATLKKKELKVELKLKELELKQREGELVKLEDAKNICVDIVSPISRRIKDMPASLAIKVNPTDPSFAKSELRIWSDEILKRIQEICESLKGSK